MNYIMHGTASEKEEILALYKSQLGREFCPWTEFYPTEKEIDFDLSRDSLFVMKNKAGRIIAAISIDLDANVEALPCWSTSLQPGGELSRLAVAIDCQNQGIARKLMAGAMEELRLRCGQPPACRIAGKERALPLAPVTPELLRGILEQATQRSAYAMQEMTRCGFVTLPGGHRLGICGTAVVQNGTITALREPSSLNLRIARQPDGIADRLRDTLWARPQSVLLCGAPGSGKTTLLRDLIRQLSDRFGWRICVVDERLELAACASGVPQFRLGAHTDVLSGAPKAAGIELLLRTMNPEWIAVDEITAEADIAAIRRASYCGVRFLATAHAADRRELESRPLYRALLQDGFFRMAAFLLPDRSVRIERGLDHA